MTTTLVELTEAQQDFEWYPTTDEMIGAVVKDLKRRAAEDHYYDRKEKPRIGSVLDIGAGDGRVLKALAEKCDCSNLYAIEKATPLIEQMPANIAIVGTDFEGQTLIDKDVGVIFCNPPYSRYEDWAVKIIKEGLCERMYLILPQRWSSSARIKAALETRETEAKVIWSGDFTHAERQARAVVDIVCIPMMVKEDGYNSDKKKDPFDAWFHETFPEVEALNHFKDEDRKQDEPHIDHALLKGYNLVERLAELYGKELKSMLASYRALCSIDPALLATVGVKAAEVKDGLHKKISGLKNKYWQELFDHLDKITARLASNSRKAIVDKMGSAVHVDFTADNAYAVVIWVLKNANEYIDSQVVALFKDLSRPENVKNYKSNQRTWDAEQWRYLNNERWNDSKREVPSRYKLEYRIVTRKYNAIGGNGHSYEWDYQGGLHKDCHDMLGDICTIANNLGFPCDYSGRVRHWTSGGAQEFYLDNGETLMRVRAFMNGNIHIQFNQDFIKALNIEASRLLGWIKSPKEACDEMGVDMVTAQRHFGVNRIFAPSECRLLTAGAEEKE